MRFPRQAKIFRGPLDAAPVAGVLLLLVLFMLLSSLVYTPGVVVGVGKTITVTSSNVVAFEGKSYKPTELDQLRNDLKHVAASEDIAVKMENDADPALGQQVSNLFQIVLPEGRNVTGTDNATVDVVVNFRGQCFYDNMLVQDAELKTKLAERLKLATGQSRKLTLVLHMDQAVELQVSTRLEALASEAGVEEVMYAERPPMLGTRR